MRDTSSLYQGDWHQIIMKKWSYPGALELVYMYIHGDEMILITVGYNPLIIHMYKEIESQWLQIGNGLLLKIEDASMGGSTETSHRAVDIHVC